MSMQLRIKMNENLWSKDKREILIEHAFEIYLQKRCKMTLKATHAEIKTSHHRRESKLWRQFQASWEDSKSLKMMLKIKGHPEHDRK